MKKKIALTGANGFLGSYLKKHLYNYYSIYSISLKNSNEIDFFLNNIKKKKFEIIINCAASLKPKKEIDFYINSKLPENIGISIANNKVKFIHISSINVIYPFLNDPYTLSKREAEKKLSGIKVTILRPSLLISDNFKLSNKLIDSYLNLKLPIHPFLFPGNIYKPVKLFKFSKFISQEIKNDYNKVINIYGSEIMTLFDLFEKSAKIRNKKTLKISLFFIQKYMPIKIKLYLSKNQVFQQLLNLNRSKIDKNDKSNIIL